MTNKPPRLNFNVPRALVNEVKSIADANNIEPSWWLRKVIEKAVAEARGQKRIEKVFSNYKQEKR
ncbi:MAG: hypothetical protein NHB32_15200 [Fischerella sp. CENA71]|nr:hypothetical protein [Fischerella sp. CENA71]